MSNIFNKKIKLEENSSLYTLFLIFQSKTVGFSTLISQVAGLHWANPSASLDKLVFHYGISIIFRCYTIVNSFIYHSLFHSIANFTYPTYNIIDKHIQFKIIFIINIILLFILLYIFHKFKIRRSICA